MPRDARFWRNVTIIAVAHIAVVIALVRWNYATGEAAFGEHRVAERRDGRAHGAGG